MFAYLFRAISRAWLLRFVATAIAALAMIPLGGCAGFFGAELNNRGGYLDQKLDSKWIVADTKQMRVLRAYAMIGSLARMSRENYYKSERQLIAQHISTAVNVAFDAYACAYSRPGECVYFDERMAELEVSVIRLAIAVFSKHENESLFQLVASQADDSAPLLKVLFSAGKLVDAASTATDAVASTGKLVKALLNFGEAAYFTGRRAGALYRDSIELAMIATLGSLDVQCLWRSNKIKSTDHDVMLTYHQFYGGADPTLDPCKSFKIGLAAWRQGSGDLADWKEFLDTDAVKFRKYLIPGETAFIQASDLIWRACDQIAETPGQLGTCLGHRGLKAAAKECGITKSGEEIKYLDLFMSENKIKDKNDVRPTKLGLFILGQDQCRLILYGKTWASRQDRRGKADARIFWMSTEITEPLANRTDKFIIPQ